MTHRRAVGLVVLALSLAGCGDNVKPGGGGGERGAVQAAVSGGLVATSSHYRVFSTVTSGDVSASSSAHSVVGGVAIGGGQ